MKAMILEQIGKPLVYGEHPKPVLDADDDVIIKIRACGVCATDLKVKDGHVNPEGLPRILGHEPVGVVVEKGNGVAGVEIGDRVVSSTYLTCHECAYCKSGQDTLCVHVKGRIGVNIDGGFAEYMKTKAQNIVKVPDSVPDEVAALLPCGGGVPYHAMVRKMRIKPTDTVIVLGTGGIGIQALQLIKLLGARSVAVDITDEKLDFAKKWGADYVVNSSKEGFMDALKAIDPLTVLLDTTGVPAAITACASALQRGGRIVLVGYSPGKDLVLPLQQVVLEELEVVGSRGVGLRDVEDLMQLYARGELVAVEAEKYPLRELNMVMEKLKNNQLSGRSVVVP